MTTPWTRALRAARRAAGRTAMDNEEAQRREYALRVRAAKEKLPPIYGRWYAGEPDAARSMLRDALGRTYFDVLCALIAMSELAATASKVPTPADLPPGHAVSVQLAFTNPDGTPGDIDSSPREHTWAARFIAATWSNDQSTLSALTHVLVEDMNATERGLAAQAVFVQTARILVRAYDRAREEGSTP